jgi:hypothetical protein
VRPTGSFRVSWTADVPAGAALRIDVRASADGRGWTSWESDVSNGATLRFDLAAASVQYRATLLGSRAAGPLLRQIDLAPLAEPASYRAQSVQTQQAPTYKVRATRMGMVGGRTANGHIIRPRDHYVSLPSWKSLSSRGGYEYQVRITYRGRSSVAPVWDVGPWNVHDNYWDVQRERFRDLRRGWPQDHAAYYEGYNGRRAEKGYVRFPTAVDIGDGVWWDDLGIRGDQAEVEISFLWLGGDSQPSAPAQPAPAPEPEPAPAPAPADPNLITVNEREGNFHGRADITWYHSPNGCGESGHAYWTYSTPKVEDSENTGRWQPNLSAERLYDVYAHVPICPNRKASTESAYYTITHRDGKQEVVVNQAKQTGWVLLGRFPFAAGQAGYVELDDITNDSMRVVWFDDVKWVAVP